MTPQNTPAPQHTEGGELDEILYNCFGIDYGGTEWLDTIVVQQAKRRLQALIDAARNQGHAAQFAKDQAEIWPEAYEEGFVDGRLVENKWWLERSLVPIIGTTYPNRFRARIAELKQSKTEAEQP